MAKEKERKLARVLYIQQHKTAKEIAQTVGVQEKTIGSWIKSEGWKEERDARKNSLQSQEANLRELISMLTQQRIDLEKESPLDPEEKIALTERKIKMADEISKWSKVLENTSKESSVQLSVYITVMEEIFDALKDKHPELYMKLIDFQETHINYIAKKLG